MRYPPGYSLSENNIYKPGFSSPDGLGAHDVSDYYICGIKGEEMIGSGTSFHSFLYRIFRGINSENSGKYSYSFFLDEEAYQSNENRAILKSIVNNCNISK